MEKYKLGIGTVENLRVIELSDFTDLKKLDDFTSSLKDINELKRYLFQKGLITLEELKENIYVLYRDKGVKRLPVIYSDMKKNLDIENLNNAIKSFSSNPEFLKLLVSHYPNISTLKRYASLNNLDISLESIFNKDIYDVNKNINYNDLRELSLLVYKFVNKVEKNKLQKDNNIDNEYPQLSVFGLDNKSETNRQKKWVLSSEGEPYFPPNSHEEAMYFKYLEELDKLPEVGPDNHPHLFR